MPDLQPWWKLWCNALDDPSLEALTLEDWARWARLALLVKRHGDGGTCGFPPPYQSLSTALKYAFLAGHLARTRERLVSAIERMPNVRVEVGSGDRPTITVTFLKWAKYQESPSTQRTRRWREKRHGDGHDERHGDGQDASPTRHRDRSRGVTEGGDVTVQEERRGEPPISPASPRRPAYPPEAFHHAGCDPAWIKAKRLCLNRAWFDASSPERRLPTLPLIKGQPPALQCPTHRVQTSAADVAW